MLGSWWKMECLGTRGLRSRWLCMQWFSICYHMSWVGHWTSLIWFCWCAMTQSKQANKWEEMQAKPVLPKPWLRRHDLSPGSLFGNTSQTLHPEHQEDSSISHSPATLLCVPSRRRLCVRMGSNRKLGFVFLSHSTKYAQILLLRESQWSPVKCVPIQHLEELTGS